MSRPPTNAAPLLLRALDRSTDPVLVVDGAWSCRYANAAAARLAGGGRQVLTGITLWAALPLLAARTTEQALRQAAATGRATSVLVRDGEHGRAWELEAVPDPGGLVLWMRDVSARHRAEAALRASEARFRGLIERAADGIAIIDPAGTLLYVSPAYLQILGLTPEELEGQCAFDTVHPDDVAPVREIFETLLRAPGQTAQARFRARHRDGSWRTVAVVGTNLMDDPAVGGVVINSRDITVQQLLELQLHEAQKMEAVGQLAGGIAHDFNNLLTVVRGNADLLLANTGATHEMRDFAQEIGAAVDRAALLTKQLLAFSRQQLLRPTLIDLSIVVRGLEPLLRQLIMAEVRLEVACGRDLPFVRADPGQFEQVLVNLIVNAREAAPHDGCVHVSTAAVRLDAPLLHAHGVIAPGEYAVLRVRDGGRGMPPEMQAQIFEPFYTTKASPGTGLGLSAVYGIVRQSGGQVQVESAVGEGSTFTIWLPAAPDATAVEESGAVAPTHQLSLVG